MPCWGAAKVVRSVTDNPDSRVAKVWKLVNDCAAADRQTVSLSHVCAAAVLAAGVDGGALSLVTRMDRRSLAYASDELGQALDDQQYSLGEGPCVEGWSTRVLVLAGDLAQAGSFGGARWPVFTPIALAAGVNAVFGFPLQLGAIRLGTLGLYRARPGALSSEQLADTQTLCGTAVSMMLAGTSFAANGTAPSWLPGTPAAGRIEVYQATGMVSVQLSVNLEDAFAALRARAFAVGVPLADIARLVVARRLRFMPGAEAEE